MNRILLLEDDISLIDGLAFTLHKNNFEIVVARTVRDAITALSEQTFDLLLLDLTLSDGSGFEVCKKARLTSNVPILFLTASDEEVNVVMGLDMGGDDYITKPFKLNELISRINALLRRAGMAKTPPAELQSNGITVKLEENRVLKDGAPLGRE
ncbi:MAG: response regulator transcription factor [Ruminococcaceae bacterium]|nr:response regulator transcription factor [Oscillospiraceae bacterium]HHV31891.1 response regulator transcription factor [Clostridiales bacterium]